MVRAVLAIVVAFALFVGAIDLPTAHRCVLAAQAVRSADSDGHGCCPDKQEAAAATDSDADLCAGDCCSSSDQAWLAPDVDGAWARSFVVLPDYLAASRGIEPPARRRHDTVAWPRGPPAHPPTRAVWLRHRSLLL